MSESESSDINELLDRVGEKMDALDKLWNSVVHESECVPQEVREGVTYVSALMGTLLIEQGVDVEAAKCLAQMLTEVGKSVYAVAYDQGYREGLKRLEHEVDKRKSEELRDYQNRYRERS